MKSARNMFVFTLTAAVLAGCGASEGGSGQALKDAAMKELYANEYSIAKPGGQCDKVENAKLADIRIGTISRKSARSTLSEDALQPLPAIIARYEFVCVTNASGKKEKKDDQWIILAIDNQAGELQCSRAGAKELIENLIQRCDFKDSR